MKETNTDISRREEQQAIADRNHQRWERYREHRRGRRAAAAAVTLASAVFVILAAVGCETGEDGTVTFTPETIGEGFETGVRYVTKAIDTMFTAVAAAFSRG